MITALHLTKDKLTVSTALNKISLSLFPSSRFVIIAFGKASIPMALAAEKCLGTWLLEGIVIAPVTLAGKDWKLRSRIFYGAQNNLPDVNSVAATQEALKCIIKNDTTNVVFLFLISGKVVSLLISDLIGDRIQFIASGPTVLQTDYMKEASQRIVTSPKWTSILSPGITSKLQECSPCHSLISPHNIIVASNRDALIEMRNYFESQGYSAYIVTTCLNGDATLVGKDFAQLITTEKNSISETLKKFGRKDDEELSGNKIALLFGGETTVVIRGEGRGGRCQEMALSCFSALSSVSHPRPFVFLTAGTDGQDGPTDAAGAFITDCDISKGIPSNATTFLETSNSYSFWSTYNDGKNHIKVGSTGTNVMEIQIVLLQFN
ncbi:MOFRL family protein [Dictyocaulus viviparus]|uniref:MOFRL family protein n=1 Tax=Dictyocaulus viviparus TaxID=29172 RepID=A0A0D8XB98_DICVI|nr:MOFRL family protein [Dictyocaulus viviparus]